MRAPKLRLAALAGLMLASTFAAAAFAQTPGRTVWDGVYTADQAGRGRDLYAARCSMCHGASLGGVDSAPALTGSPFLTNWNGTTAADLFSRIHDTMPADEPGALSTRQTSDVESFIFQSNGFPAGTASLPTNPMMLTGTGIVAQRPRP